jgi:hypothetical protein
LTPKTAQAYFGCAILYAYFGGKLLGAKSHRPFFTSTAFEGISLGRQEDH